MQLNDYQEWTRSTAIYPKDQALVYLILGLGSEVGELQGKLKKFIRDDTIDAEAFLHEVGDVYWYLTRILDEVGHKAEDVLQMNHNKLEDRKARSVLKGSGDNR